MPQPVSNCTICHGNDTHLLPPHADAGAQVFNINGQILGVDLSPTSWLMPIRPPISATWPGEPSGPRRAGIGAGSR